MKIKNVLGVIALSLCASTVSFANQETVDANINSAVQNKISSDLSLSGTTINVKTEKGEVSLSGNVNSETQADTATELAQSIDGVRDVSTSSLTIKGSNHPLADAAITAKVKGMFIQQKLLGDKDIAAMTITVETNNGVVSLSGTSSNQQEIDNAIKIAETVKDVKKVKSTVKVSN